MHPYEIKGEFHHYLVYSNEAPPIYKHLNFNSHKFVFTTVNK